MSKLKPQEVEQRKREIIEESRVCFLRNGFHQTTTDEICREAAITPGGLYHYFGSKEEIISAVIEDAAHITVQSLRTTAEASGDVRTAVQALDSLFFQWIRDPQLDSVTRLDMEIWAESLRNEKLASITRESRALRRQWLESLIRGAIQEGVYAKEVDPRGLANLIMAIFDGLRLGRLLWRGDFDLDAALRALVLMTTGQLTNGNHVELAPEAPAAGRA